jgi:hypothetical protein
MTSLVYNINLNCFIKKFIDFYYNNPRTFIWIYLFFSTIFGRTIITIIDPFFYENEWDLIKQIDFINQPKLFFKKLIVSALFSYIIYKIYIYITNYIIEMDVVIKKNRIKIKKLE